MSQFASFGSSVPSLLFRRTNIRTPAEIEAARRGPLPADGEWRSGIKFQEEPKRYQPREVIVEPDKRIAELWLSGHTVP
jgi:hypothetical protein